MRHIFKQPPKLARSRKLGYIAWRARDEALRLGVAPPPPEPQAGDEVQAWMFTGPGWAHRVQLLVPADKGRNRPRSDQHTLMIDGQQVAERISISSALRLIQTKYLPRQQTRAQRREWQSWANVRPDRDDAPHEQQGWANA
jgi:hypothetical protein